MAKINIHAGHNPAGKVACGVVGFLNESNQARKVKNTLIQLLRAQGHLVYDCTCDNGASQQDVLNKIVTKCNAHAVDLDISIHFNSGRSDKKGDGKSGGCEVFVTQNTGLKGRAAMNICKEISKIGFINRGVKVSDGLYFLNHTKAPALLIECCFVDDKDDYELYKKGNYQSMAKAIAAGIEKTLD